MKTEDCFYLGFISKKQGNIGKVIAYLDVDDPLEYRKLESVFIEINDKLIPFFIKEITIKDKGYASICFEDVTDLDSVFTLLKKSMYLPLTQLPKLIGNHFYFHEIIGFKVMDSAEGYIGVVKDVNENVSNPLLKIIDDDIEILIPLQEEFIEAVDRKNYILKINAPSGLIDIYRNNAKN